MKQELAREHFSDALIPSYEQRNLRQPPQRSNEPLLALAHVQAAVDFRAWGLFNALSFFALVSKNMEKEGREKRKTTPRRVECAKFFEGARVENGKIAREGG